MKTTVEKKNKLIILTLVLNFICTISLAQEHTSIINKSKEILSRDKTTQNDTTTFDSRNTSDEEEATGDDEKVKTAELPVFPSPKVAEFMKYTDFPEVDQFGGIPIQVPIFDIQFDDLSHNIFLSYNLGGIKVNQEATWVGLGWNLVAGGSVSRVVMDLPDDEVRNYSYTVTGNPGYNVNIFEYGWLSNPDFIKNFPELDMESDDYKNSLYFNWDQQGTNGNAGIALKYIDFSNRNHNQAKHDCEPDVFYINVGNINEKFIFDFDGVPRLISPNQDIDIQYITNDETSETRITEFIIKDNLGNEYTFGESYIEKTTLKTIVNDGCSSGMSSITNANTPIWSYNCFRDYQPSTTYNSVWYLKEISSPKKNSINFYYSKPANKLTMDIPVTKCQTFNSLGLDNPWNTVKSITQEIETFYLDYIEFNDNTIDFEISERNDIMNGFKLDRLLVKEPQNTIYQFDFIYGYMNPGGTIKEKRLVLNELIQDQKFQFSFNYYPGSLPSKDSFKQDFWGYYSEKSTSLIPKIYVYPDLDPENQYRCYPISGQGNYTEIEGSDRSVDSGKILTGMLNSIVYPTGGSTMYIFEPNEYYDELYNGNIMGGGIRISKLQKLGIDNEVLLSKSYNYNVNNKSSGVLIYDLAYATPTNYTPYNNLTNHYYLWEHSDWSDSKKDEYFTVRFTHNQYPSSNLDGFMIGYTNIEISEEENGRVVREYYPPMNYKTNSPTVQTTPMNAWGSNYLDNSLGQQLIAQNDGVRNLYTKSCTETNNEYYWWYHTPFANDHFEPVSYCSTSDEFEFYTDDGMYYFGGNGGYFTPMNYLCGIDLALESFWVFDYAASGFRAYRNKNWIPFYNDDINIQNSFIIDKSVKGHDFTSVLPGKVTNSGKNIFPYPPLTINTDDEIVYSKLKKEQYFKEGETTNPLQSIDYHYEIQGTPDESVFGLVYDLQYTVPTFNKASPMDAALIDAGLAYFLTETHSNYIQRKTRAKYYYKTNCTAMLDHVDKTQYFTDGNVVSTTYYEYTDHYIVSKITNELSNEKIVEQVIKYPFNYNTGIYSEMTNNNMFYYPVEKINIVDNYVVNGKLKTFKKDDGVVVNSVLYNFLKTTNVLQSDCEFDGIEPDYNYWTANIYFDDYKNGDLVNYHENNNYTTTILWGYNYQYPILKVDNATYEYVRTAIGLEYDDLQTKNSEDLKVIFKNLIEDSKLEEHVLHNSLINAYTYDPLIGITSKTDPNGNITTYIYDDFNRFVTKRNETDEENIEILKHIEYNYFEATLDVTPESFVVENEGGTFSVSINSNLKWTVTENSDFLSLVPPTEGTGDGSFQFYCSENTDIADKTASITITGNSISKTISITLLAADYINVTPDLECFLPMSGYGSCYKTITSNVEWTADYLEGDHFYTFSPTTNSGNVTSFIVNSNGPLQNSKTGKIRISGNGMAVDITVTQEAHP